MIEKLNWENRIPTNVLSNNAVRYGIYDEEGNFLRYEYIKKEDEPINVGTVINKLQGDKIDNNIEELIGERSRVDRYNIPVIQSDETKNVILLDNKIDNYFEGQKVLLDLRPNDENSTDISENVIPVLSSNNSNGFEVIATNNKAGAYRITSRITSPLESMFRIEEETDITILFPFYIKTNRISFKMFYIASQCTIEALDDNNKWEIVATNVGQPAVDTSAVEIPITNEKYYKGFKIKNAKPRASSNDGYIGNFEINTGKISIIDLAKETYININDKGLKKINNLKLQDNVSLIYRENEFISEYLSATTNLSIKTGTISHNAVIPQTEGFSNYMYIVSFKEGVGTGELLGGANTIATSMKCEVNQNTRTVTAQIGAYYGNDVSRITYTNAKANYWEIAWN